MVEKKEVLFQDFSDLKITEETRNDILTNPQKYSDCDIRIRLGKFYTDEECQKKIKDGLSRELPGGKTLCKKRIRNRKV